ncbi:MAG: Sua5/YciO/YrdC/YwlC family protein [Candidatus Parcubacteria bacterium]|nr:Sua5/YciO/YrdC/YwlC family protein [Candidatus Paceibacterota bacterium]
MSSNTYIDLINPQLINQIQQGDIGILPTDTSYGLCCLATNKISVERIQKLRGGPKNKPGIILIDSLDKALELGAVLFGDQRKILDSIYPANFSVLVKHAHNDKYKHLYEGSKYLSFRIPTLPELRKLIRNVGPIFAPLACPVDLSPASTVSQSRQYFSDQLDFYVDKGELVSLPSTMAIMNNDKFQVIRQGSYFIPKSLLGR